MVSRVVGGLGSWRDIRTLTALLYLVPRLLPLITVASLTALSGLHGLGEVALSLSIWQFLLLVSDWGVSQWLLTKTVVAADEVRTAILGRGWTSLLCLLAVVVLKYAGVLHVGPLLFGALAASVGLSFGQMAFAWELQAGRRMSATSYVVLEFALPVAVIGWLRTPSSALAGIMLLKTAISLGLTARSVALPAVQSWRLSIVSGLPQGLRVQQFGFYSAALSLTSFASGTGELALLSHGSPSAYVGAYRLVQTLASLGSIVGFASQAPLMRSDPTNMDRRRLVMVTVVLCVTAATLVGAGDIAALTIMTHHALPDFEWLIYSVIVLGVSAVMNTASVVPLTLIARRYGARFSLRIGVCTAATYWTAIAVLGAIQQRYLAPTAVLVAAAIGLSGNLYIAVIKSGGGR